MECLLKIIPVNGDLHKGVGGRKMQSLPASFKKSVGVRGKRVRGAPARLIGGSRFESSSSRQGSVL